MMKSGVRPCVSGRAPGFTLLEVLVVLVIIALATTLAAMALGGGLEGMVLPDLRRMAGGLGVKGTSGMRKADLIAAIRTAQSSPRSGNGEAGTTASRPPSGRGSRRGQGAPERAETPPAPAAASDCWSRVRRRRRSPCARVDAA